MEKKFTPGPWMAVYGKMPESNYSIEAHSQSNWPYYVAQTISGLTTELEKANANLIAAAPELLEALEELSELVEILASKLGCQTYGAAPKSDADSFGALYALDKAREAINKAYGKEASNG